MQFAKLTASDATINDKFGASVAIDGNTIIVGSSGYSSNSAYLFDVSTGNQLIKLTISDPASGYIVDVDSDIAVIGEPQCHPSGSVSLFNKPAFPAANLNKRGGVDFKDLSILAENWLKGI